MYVRYNSFSGNNSAMRQPHRNQTRPVAQPMHKPVPQPVSQVQTKPEPPPIQETKKEPPKKGLFSLIPDSIFCRDTGKFLKFLDADDLLLIVLCLILLQSDDEDDKLLIIALAFIFLSDKIDLSKYF